MKMIRVLLALSLAAPSAGFAQMVHRPGPGNDPRRGGGDRGFPGRGEPRRDFPRHDPQPPRRDPVPPVVIPPRRDPQPPHRNPVPPVVIPPRRDPQPPHRNPVPPVVIPPRRDPQPPRRQPWPPRHDPRPEPPHRRPPVIHPEPGRGRLPRPLPNPGRIDDHRRPQQPVYDGRGGRLGGGVVIVAPGAVVVGRTFGHPGVWAEINRRIAMESALSRGAYYWYYDSGMRWCHHYDAWGVHWFGFYLGDAFFWSRWNAGRLWWEDAPRGRWLYWDGGSWWWRDPSGPVYLYRDGVYYRYTPVAGGAEVKPEAPEAGDEAAVYSEDGTRMAQILGERREAFLYDATGEEPRFIAYLTDDAEEVRFSAEDGALRVLVTTKDASGGKGFRLFDADGRPFGAPADSVDPDSQLEGSPAFESLGSGAPRF